MLNIENKAIAMNIWESAITEYGSKENYMELFLDDAWSCYYQNKVLKIKNKELKRDILFLQRRCDILADQINTKEG